MKRYAGHPTMNSAIGFAALCAVAGVNVQASDIQVGRYSLFAAAPTEAQIDPLQATVTLQFPETVRSVGDAVRYALVPSGFRLADPGAMTPATTTLFTLPLPQVHRHLGPMRLQRVLETLAGPVFRLIEDPAHRLLAFEHCAPAPR